ncbi:MAG: hypothetical protein HWE25_14095 [Alphaproteobacteria bacterium]|nr:hypothetical protein [Alphaproteobacteria bacterium]
MPGRYREVIDKLNATQANALMRWAECTGQNNDMPPSLPAFLEAIGQDLIESSVLFHCHDPLDFEYASIGNQVVDQISANFEGKRMSNLQGKGPGSKIWTFLSDVLAQEAPNIEAMPYVGPNPDLSHASLVALPFRDENTGNNQILLVVTFEKWPFLKEASDLRARIDSLRDFLSGAAN